MYEILIQGKKYIQVNREAKLGDLVLAKKSGGNVFEGKIYEVNYVSKDGRLGHQSNKELGISLPDFYLYDFKRTKEDFTVLTLKNEELSERKRLIKKYSKKIEKHRNKIKKLEKKMVEISYDLSEKEKELLNINDTKINYADAIFIRYDGHEYERVNSEIQGGDLVVFTENNTSKFYSQCNRPYKVIEKRGEMVFIGDSGDEFSVYSSFHKRTPKNTIVFRKVEIV